MFWVSAFGVEVSGLMVQGSGRDVAGEAPHVTDTQPLYPRHTPQSLETKSKPLWIH